MGYSLQFDQQRNLLCLTYDQTSTLADRVHALNAVVEYLTRDATIGIFIDARNAVEVLDDDEQKALAELLGAYRRYFQRNRTAVLKPPSLHPHIVPRAYLNGHQHVVEFDNEYEALAWLAGEFD